MTPTEEDSAELDEAVRQEEEDERLNEVGGNNST